MQKNKNHVGNFNSHRVVDETPDRERIMSENSKRNPVIVSIDGEFYREVVVSADECAGCVFEHDRFCTDIPDCSHYDREDGQSVIFKKIGG